MKSSQLISLFSERKEANERSASIVVSAVIHTAVIALLFYGLLSAPQVKDRNLTDRIALRHVDLNMPEPEPQKSKSGIEYPSSNTQAKALPPGGNPHDQLAMLRQTVQAKQGPQTLVQPNLPEPKVTLPPTPVPTVVVWTPEKAPVKAIVPPQMPALSADVKLSVAPPNQEQRLADLAITSSQLATKQQPILPSTTSPVVVHGPAPQQAPATPTETTAPPTPASVLSLSDLQMKQGTVFLPPANESASSNSPGALAQGQAKDASQAGKGNPASNAGGVGAGQGANNRNGTKTSTGSAPSQGAGSGEGNGYQPTTAHITLPKDGQFGSVVVGAALETKYPETVGVWSGRLAYTVYLHLGMAKSWILQYSMPRNADVAETGTVTHLDAPWPYNVVRPNLAHGAFNADALMVHGYVNPTGRFEALSIVFPPDFEQGQFVLESLQQWQFRAATENGRAVRVEVLLIIPDA